MKSSTEEEQGKSTQWFVNFLKCPPGRKAVLKQLPKSGFKAKLPRSSPPHRHKSWNANVTGREKWKLQINNWARPPHCPPFQIHTALLANPPEGSLLWNESMQRAQISKSQDSHVSQSQPSDRFNSGPADFTQTSVLLPLSVHPFFVVFHIAKNTELNSKTIMTNTNTNVTNTNRENRNPLTSVAP